ncbi:hypothetical protein WR25_16951 isoform B [Diploscapter pachys]|nr:hypothetical protein WR25_16951 isoform B [Diploscapter pachys]
MAPSAKVFCGNLPNDIRQKEVEDIFEKYGKIRSVDIKGGRGPLYAFIEFDDSRDAEDAVRGRDGYDYDGRRLRVEFTKSAGPRGGGGRFDRDSRGGRGDPGRGPSGKRTGFRVSISGLPLSGSWQDLKDHMREVGEVVYADVFKDGTCVVEYARYEDVKYAMKKLDDTKFRSHEGETSYIRVKESSSSGGGGGGSGSGRGGSRDRSRSPDDRRGGGRG